MNTQSFQSLIQAITGRDLVINTTDAEIIGGKEYQVYKVMPLTNGKISFKWKAALSDEKMLRSFITAFTTKYKEPNPKTYDYTYGGKEYTWAAMSDEAREHARFHHANHMYHKKDLMQQIEDNFKGEKMHGVMIHHGFYNTEYGVGIFALYQFDSVINAIQAMKEHLTKRSIPFSNEFSDARWVYRFKLNLTKENHGAILQDFINFQSNENA
jgi:hypothetical protein